MYGGKSKKKNKTRKTREMKPKECSACGETQHNVPQSVEQNKKIKPKEVFGKDYAKGRSQSDTYNKKKKNK